MAQPFVAGDLAKVSLITFDSTQIGENTFWYSCFTVNPSTPLTDLDFADNFDAVVGPSIPAILDSNAEYRGVIVQIYSGLTFKPKWTSTDSTVHAGPGTGGGISLPKQTAGITSWYTALPKQANRGRTYWPFPSTGMDEGDGFPTDAYVTAINNIALLIRNITVVAIGGRSASFNQVLFHRKVPGITNIVTPASHKAWATQRRRGTYGRPQANPPI